MTTRIVILAAGQGKRMGLPIPKVLAPLHGQPLITHLIKSIQESGVDPRPVIVIAPDAQPLFEKEVGANSQYVVQQERRGTGHALLCAYMAMESKPEIIVMLNGDMPFIKPETIKKLVTEQSAAGSAMTLVTNQVPGFTDEFAPFYDFGRIVRDGKGGILRIIEKKDATPDELAITEVNSSYFCFDAKWLGVNLPKLGTNNAQQEYYVTDLVKIAIGQGDQVATISASPTESIGINTPEHLEHAHKVSLS